MVASLAHFLLVSRFVVANERRLAVVAILTIGTWLLVTFLTRPEKPEVLASFYARIRPGGGGWGPVALARPDVAVDQHLLGSIAAAFLATGVIYLTLPAIGYFLFGETLAGLLSLGGALGLGASAYVLVQRLGWEKIVR
jgi:hypothetical protein